MNMRRAGLVLAVATAALTPAACTDAKVAHLRAYGDRAQIIQYSGGVEINRFCSTGKVANPGSGSDGYEFMDAKTMLLTQVSGDVVITYGHHECSQP